MRRPGRQALGNPRRAKPTPRFQILLGRLHELILQLQGNLARLAGPHLPGHAQGTRSVPGTGEVGADFGRQLDELHLHARRLAKAEPVVQQAGNETPAVKRGIFLAVDTLAANLGEVTADRKVLARDRNLTAKIRGEYFRHARDVGSGQRVG